MWPGKAAVPLAAPVVPGDRLKSSEKVWPGENDARRRCVEGEGGAAEDESSPDMVESMGREVERGLSDEDGSSSPGAGGLENLKDDTSQVLTLKDSIRTLRVSLNGIFNGVFNCGVKSILCLSVAGPPADVRSD